MFEDLIKKNKKHLTNDRDNDITWNNGCHNCNHSSYILSNQPNKVLCQVKKKHMDKNYYCDLWLVRMFGGASGP